LQELHPIEAGNTSGIIGPPFVDALVSKLDSDQVAVEGVNNYPADIAGFLAGGGDIGNSGMSQV